MVHGSLVLTISLIVVLLLMGCLTLLLPGNCRYFVLFCLCLILTLSPVSSEPRRPALPDTLGTEKKGGCSIAIAWGRGAWVLVSSCWK